MKGYKLYNLRVSPDRRHLYRWRNLVEQESLRVPVLDIVDGCRAIVFQDRAFYVSDNPGKVKPIKNVPNNLMAKDRAVRRMRIIGS